jgi:hypothetical protein
MICYVCKDDDSFITPSKLLENLYIIKFKGYRSQHNVMFSEIVFGILLWDQNARSGPEDFEGKMES